MHRSNENLNVYMQFHMKTDRSNGFKYIQITNKNLNAIFNTNNTYKEPKQCMKQITMHQII